MLQALDCFNKKIKNISSKSLKEFDILCEKNVDKDECDVELQALLDIFSDKQKISSVNVEFIPEGTQVGRRTTKTFKLIIKFNFNGKNQSIILMCLSESTYVSFMIIYDKLG